MAPKHGFSHAQNMDSHTTQEGQRRKRVEAFSPVRKFYTPLSPCLSKWPPKPTPQNINQAIVGSVAKII